jgi:dTDP-4-dehydrorhamnose reductase
VRVAVIGANGQLGTDVCAAYRSAGHDVLELVHADVDIRDRDAVHRVLTPATLDLVVNTAAMHNVEACESDADAALAVNATGAYNLATAGCDLGFALLHVSTDYVFDGSKGRPYVESDAPNPLSVYGRTKLEGEELIRETLPKHFIVRTSGLYGRAACRAKPSGNFIQRMLWLARERGEVRVVTDEIVTPTYTEDLARQIVRLSESPNYGLYHATSQGETSWFDYASAIFDLGGMQVHMTPAASRDFPQKAPRPKYSVLENEALRRAGLDIMPHWRESLARYLVSLQ